MYIPLQAISGTTFYDVGCAQQLSHECNTNGLTVVGIIARVQPEPLRHFSTMLAHALAQLQMSCSDAICWLFNDFATSGPPPLGSSHVVCQLTAAGLDVIRGCDVPGAHTQCSTTGALAADTALVEIVRVSFLTRRSLGIRVTPGAPRPAHAPTHNIQRLGGRSQNRHFFHKTSHDPRGECGNSFRPPTIYEAFVGHPLRLPTIHEALVGIP